MTVDLPKRKTAAAKARALKEQAIQSGHHAADAVGSVQDKAADFSDKVQDEFASIVKGLEETASDQAQKHPSVASTISVAGSGVEKASDHKKIVAVILLVAALAAFVVVRRRNTTR